MRRAIRSPFLAIAFVILFAGTALATPGSAFGPPTTLARGTLSESAHYNTGAVKFQTKGPVDVVTQTIPIGASGSSGWHTHPGVVLVTVASGAVIRYEADCSSIVYGAGSAFTESGDHAGLVRNASTTAGAVVYATFIVPEGTSLPNLRIDGSNPGCPLN